MPRHLEARNERPVHADAGPAGQQDLRHTARPRQKLLRRILRRDPALDRVAPQRHLLLAERERGAGCDLELQTHEVGPGDQLGDGMLHLQPGVDFEEVEPRPIDEELHGSGVSISHGPGGGDRRPAHGGPKLRVHRRRRRLLEQLLVAPLDRALALTEVDGAPVRIGHNLDLDVA